MFTGIIQEVGRVAGVGSGSLTIAAKDVLAGIVPGGSLAVNGACLTVTQFDDRSFTADIMAETRRRTNLGRLKYGDPVNLERPLGLGGEVGGHLVQGHVDGTGTVTSVRPEGEARVVTMSAPPEVMRYLVPKGFVAVDGASLTITEVGADSFSVSLVSFTLDHTTLKERRPGDAVNLEVDIIAKYVARQVSPGSGGITHDFLRENGFLVN